MKRSVRSTWEDFYSRKAKKEQYPARSVYKLQEIQQKMRIIKKGDRVLDLGCAPGSWLLYASELTGAGGKIIGVDLQPIEIHLPQNVRAMVGNVLSPDEAFFSDIGAHFNVVMSDMAPSTIGAKNADAARSVALCESALSVALQVLLPGGSFICKIFQGQGFKEFSELVKSSFQQLRIFKPRSCRKESREIYIIGIGKKSI